MDSHYTEMPLGQLKS
uniref:Uncharacterized protein n=1 Tax=Rhizophora mucronata TaxID=61149 RepID=A0A2P2QBR4_RHIMU